MQRHVEQAERERAVSSLAQIGDEASVRPGSDVMELLNAVLDGLPAIDAP
jgi:hypothetical protein